MLIQYGISLNLLFKPLTQEEIIEDVIEPDAELSIESDTNTPEEIKSVLEELKMDNNKENTNAEDIESAKLNNK